MFDPTVFASARRICFFAHYDADRAVADYVLHYLDALRNAGFVVAVASTATLDSASQGLLRAHCDALLMRHNVGLDFGGWQELHALLPDIDPDWLLLCNDSVYGPIHDLTGFIEKLTAPQADFYGIIGSIQGDRHAQSWFVLLRRSAVRSAPFRALMNERITAAMTKRAIIERFEVGLTADLERAGFVAHFAYDPDRDSAVQRQSPFNTAHVLWRQVIESGMCPFVKIELLRDNPMLIPDVSRWREVVGGRSPALVALIERDLARRPTRPALTPMERVQRTLHAPPSALNRLRPLLQADFRLSIGNHRIAAKANAVGFGLAAAIFRVVRAPINRLRRRPV